MTSICEMVDQLIQKKQEEKQIQEDQAANTRYWKIPAYYDDDDDEEESNSLKDNNISVLPPYSAVTPNETVDSLIMGDEHLDTVSATESDEFIKSSVENPVPNPSESKGENGCDVPSCFTTFSNILFDDEHEFDSADDQSLHNEDFPEEMFSNPLFEEEISSIKIDQHHFNAESDLNKLMEKMTSICEMVGQLIQKKQEEKQIQEDQVANARYWKILAYYDDDDDYNFAITPNEPVDSLSMRDEHLDTVLATESDEFIKSSVENLIPKPSESEGENGYDMLACFTTFSNILFDAEYEFDSVDDQSLHNEDFPEEIFSNPLFEEEINSMRIDQHNFNAESDLIESLLNHDSSIIPSSSKIDSLLDEFAGELTLLKSIPPGIDETDYHPENEICLSQRLLYDNSSPRLPEEFVYEISNADVESFSPFPIRIEDSNSFMEEIDLTFTPNDPMPPSIEEDDDDPRDILIREELLENYSFPLLEKESFHFDIPLSSRPPAKPTDGMYFLSEELPDIDSFNDIHLHFDDDPLSGSTTYSTNTLLEEFADELALIPYPMDYDDNRACDIESDIREIEFLLFQGEDSDYKDSIDQSVLPHCDDLFVDPTPEMFTDEQPSDYSFPPRFDVYPDDFLEIESDANFDDDFFDSEGEKIKEPDLLIDRLDLPYDIRSEDDVLPSPDNEDKPDDDFSCSKWKEYSSLGCSFVLFLSILISSSMGEFDPAHLTLNKRFVGGTPCLSF
nr:hypothetical protein [Tanacetum cinerariifolium]